MVPRIAARCRLAILRLAPSAAATTATPPIAGCSCSLLRLILTLILTLLSLSTRSVLLRLTGRCTAGTSGFLTLRRFCRRLLGAGGKHAMPEPHEKSRFVRIIQIYRTGRRSRVIEWYHCLYGGRL